MTTPDTHPIRELLRAARGKHLDKPHRLSVPEFAKRLGVSASSLYDSEAMAITRGMQLDIVMLIAEFICIRVAELEHDMARAYVDQICAVAETTPPTGLDGAASVAKDWGWAMLVAVQQFRERAGPYAYRHAA